jgi:formate--tetrahydrofolate ligase
MRDRLGKIVVGTKMDETPLTAGELGCAGAMAVMLKDALKPNLLQSSENTPIFIHTGPFGNIAHGNSSIIADLISTRLVEYTVTESGFGADLGFEKFVDIKCRIGGFIPSVAVIVSSVRAMKIHSGRYKYKSIKLKMEDPESVALGCANLEKMIEIVHLAGIPAVVAINRFSQDYDSEIETLSEHARMFGAEAVEVVEPYFKGGEGCISLAKKIIKLLQRPAKFDFIYKLDLSTEEKIEKIAKICYGAEKVIYSELAQRRLALYKKWGFEGLPICMAKTQFSLSGDPQLKGRPEHFTIKIEDLRLSAGAGFLYPIIGEIKLMPGLPRKTFAEKMELDDKGTPFIYERKTP